MDKFTLIYIQGNPSNLSTFSQYQLSGTFESSGRGDNGPTTTSMQFMFASDINVQGTFTNNFADDIQLYNTRTVNIGPGISDSDGHSLVNMPNGYSSTNVSIHNWNISDPSSNGTYPAITVAGGVDVTVEGNTTTETGTAAAPYGLYVASNSTGSVIYGNSFHAQTVAPYEVLDTSAQILAYGTGLPGHATCWKAAGQLGYCSNVVSSTGTCTCH